MSLNEFLETSRQAFRQDLKSWCSECAIRPALITNLWGNNFFNRWPTTEWLDAHLAKSLFSGDGLGTPSIVSLPLGPLLAKMVIYGRDFIAVKKTCFAPHTTRLQLTRLQLTRLMYWGWINITSMRPCSQLLFSLSQLWQLWVSHLHCNETNFKIIDKPNLWQLLKEPPSLIVKIQDGSPNVLQKTIVILVQHFRILSNEVIEDSVVSIMICQRNQHIFDHLKTTWLKN